jgi:hypothetical protein
MPQVSAASLNQDSGSPEITGANATLDIPVTHGRLSSPSITLELTEERSESHEPRDARHLWRIAKYAVLTCIRCRLHSDWSPSGKQAETRERFIELFSEKELAESDWAYYLDIDPLDSDDAEELKGLVVSLAPQDRSYYISLAHYRRRRTHNFAWATLNVAIMPCTDV